MWVKCTNGLLLTNTVVRAAVDAIVDSDLDGPGMFDEAKAMGRGCGC
jgi:hypothetical protein